MTRRFGFARGTLPLGLASALLGAGAGAETIDLYGVTRATLAWADAAGPVAGYYVVVTPEAEHAYLAGVVDEPRATIRAGVGDSLTISVVAFDADGKPGPLSPPSPTLRFNPPQDTSPPGDGGDPPGEPDPDPPAPPDDGDGDPPQPPLGAPLDLTGDGFSDLLVRQASGDLLLWRMRGGAVLASDPIEDLHPAWEIVGGGDYDGDGVADLLWEELAGGRLAVSLFRDAKPGAPMLLDLAGLDASEEWRVGGSGDFDGDGRDDVMLVSRVLGESEILYLVGGRVDARRRLPGHRGAFSVVATDDVDGDGVDEIVWRDELRRELLVSEVDGAEQVAGAIAGWRVIGSGDFDGDGRADLFAEQVETRRVQAWLFHGGSIAGVVELPAASGDRVASHVGDYDADARSDLVWHGAGDGVVEIWFSDGDGVSAEPVANAGTGSEIANGADGSDDAGFRARLCDADLNGDGVVSAGDMQVLLACHGRPAIAECGPADMDSDAQVTATDLELFRRAFGGHTCSVY